MHRELEVSSNSNDDDDVQIIPKAAKVKREIIPSRFRRPPFTNDGRNQKKPRKKVESKESVIRNNMKTHQITDWQNEEDINDLFCFLDKSKIHGELYNDNGMSLVNCGDLSRLLDPSGWLGDEVSQLHHLDIGKIFRDVKVLHRGKSYLDILRDVYACMVV
ncbi:hypothetical protein MKW92_042820 [Papaver armeniacum]|nr:hypothetical protein MKW92_042820 [Papaver armeniacum]